MRRGFLSRVVDSVWSVPAAPSPTLTSYPDPEPEPELEAAITLRRAFHLLREIQMPVNPRVTIPETTAEGKAALNRIRYATDEMMRSINLGFTKQQPNNRIMAGIFHANLPLMFKWFYFICKESSWIYCELPTFEASWLGLRAASECIINFFDKAPKELQIAATDTPGFTALYLWMWEWCGPIDGNSFSFQAAVQERDCPVIVLLSLIMNFDDERTDNMHRHIASISPQRQRQFIESAMTRMDECSTLATLVPDFKRRLPHWIMWIIFLTVRFIDIPSFAREFAKAGFPARALEIAIEYKHLKASPDYDDTPSRKLPFPVAVSKQFFPPQPGKTTMQLVRETLPGMIRAGLLQVFVDHLLSQRENEPYPWFAWVYQEPTNHPFNVVTFLCVHLPIFEATQAALKKIPSSKVKVMERGWYAKHWTPWLKTFRLYEHVWDHHWKEVGTKTVSLCHNLNHHLKKNITAPFQAKECSNCKIAVYCSIECQKEDWGTFHKEECPQGRCYRVDRRLAASWPAHSHRAFFLSLLHRGVLNWEVGMPSDSILPVTTPTWSTPVLEYTHMPFTSAHKAKVERSKNLVMQWNTLYCPPKVIFNSLGAFLKFTHGGVAVYRDPRWLEMYRELLASTSGSGMNASSNGTVVMTRAASTRVGDGRNRRTRLALCVAFDGLYWIYVLGRFAVVSEERKTRVELLNGYVKVEERDKIDEGMVSDLIE